MPKRKGNPKCTPQTVVLKFMEDFFVNTNAQSVASVKLSRNCYRCGAEFGADNQEGMVKATHILKHFGIFACVTLLKGNVAIYFELKVK